VVLTEQWHIWVCFRLQKDRFGWADYRLQSIEATVNWQALVFAAYALFPTPHCLARHAIVIRCLLWLRPPFSTPALSPV